MIAGRTGAQRRVLVDSARAWAASRILCWVAGVGAVLVFGAHAGPHDPLHYTAPFGSFGNTLVAPAARWDSAWYLLIADHGYAIPRATAYFPLYPIGARVVGFPLGSSLVGGIVVSLAALLAALYYLQRLAEIELGPKVGRRTMLLLAFFPAGVFLSAVYGESLLIALSIGAVYAARRGRWGYAAILGGLATATRPTGFLLMVPIVLLYLYGPREDREEPTPWARRGRYAALLPRYRIGREAAWLLVLPIPFVAYLTYAGTKFHDFAIVSNQDKAWGVGFTFPLVTVWHALGRAGSGLVRVFDGRPPRNGYEVAVFCLCCVAAVGVFRRLPFAYGAYVVAGILFVTSFPIGGENLSGFTRYMAPIFPLLMWTAAWASERRGAFRVVITAFAVVMTIEAARFATWHFVG